MTDLWEPDIDIPSVLPRSRVGLHPHPPLTSDSDTEGSGTVRVPVEPRRPDPTVDERVFKSSVSLDPRKGRSKIYRKLSDCHIPTRS